MVGAREMDGEVGAQVMPGSTGVGWDSRGCLVVDVRGCLGAMEHLLVDWVEKEAQEVRGNKE